jgi:hypothetical protein
VERPFGIDRQHWWPGVIGAAGLAYALGASFTRPFTLAADVVTAVALVVAVGVTTRTIRNRPNGDPPVAGATAGRQRWTRWGAVWLVPLGAVTAWELYSYAHLPRQQHPTLSVLIDTLDSTHLGKTVAFAAWLGLGWFLAAR